MWIKKIWFDTDHIYAVDEEGHEYRQSLLWYPKLQTATDEQRASYTFGLDGIHWRALDEDISFESFAYDDDSLGMNASLLHNYINGFKKPSEESVKKIFDHIHKLGKEMSAACL